MLEEIKVHYITEIKELLNDSTLYYKKILWFYGNAVCTICNPKEVLDFQFEEDKISVDVNVTNCYDQLLA